MRITRIEFSNYKAMQEFALDLSIVNLLVGKNNSGKSTILSALRILEYAMRIAQARNPTRVEDAAGKLTIGHHIPEANLPTSIENVHTDYTDVSTLITFTLENGNSLLLYFPRDGGCILYWDAAKTISSAAQFRQQFPVQIRAVPVLGPLEQEELLVTDETVKRASGTPRAARHFRNYWYRNPQRFPEFRDMVEATWPGMSIAMPELHAEDRRLVMFCAERRIDRELFWAGFGFQIWCQLLTHLSRCEDADLIVVDEPEVYLHPDVQRQLLPLLRALGPSILLATHSAAILSGAQTDEILLVDKRQNTTSRLSKTEVSDMYMLQ
jgi:energy-coupling factor transporter ATP-binding protein EcfA2